MSRRRFADGMFVFNATSTQAREKKLRESGVRVTFSLLRARFFTAETSTRVDTVRMAQKLRAMEQGVRPQYDQSDARYPVTRTGSPSR
jgi:hypothetical protein